MLTRISFALILILAAPAIRAADPEPTEASVKQLLEVMKLHSSLDSIAAQMDQIMKNVVEQASLGKPLTSNAQKSVERCRADVHTFIRDELSWDKLEPVYIQIYQNTFTQNEVNAMIAFYKTPVGQSVVSKLGVAMQKSQNATMQTMRPMMQRIQQMKQEVAGEMQTPK
jgi:uncharacterized protein